MERPVSIETGQKVNGGRYKEVENPKFNKEIHIIQATNAIIKETQRLKEACKNIKLDYQQLHDEIIRLKKEGKNPKEITDTMVRNHEGIDPYLLDEVHFNVNLERQIKHEKEWV